MLNTILTFALVYFIVGLIVMVWSAYETGKEFCEFKIQAPEQPIQIQFSNLWFQVLAWPGVLVIKFVQWQYSDQLKAAVERFNRGRS